MNICTFNAYFYKIKAMTELRRHIKFFFFDTHNSKAIINLVMEVSYLCV
jgi:hypothetical protein